MGNSRFPLFVDLTGRRAVVVGGGPVGLRRAEVLCRFGAEGSRKLNFDVSNGDTGISVSIS